MTDKVVSNVEQEAVSTEQVHQQDVVSAQELTTANEELAMLDERAIESETNEELVVEAEDVEDEEKDEEEESSSESEQDVAADQTAPAEPMQTAEAAPAMIETSEQPAESEPEVDEGIAASTWLWGIAGAGALAYALDSDTPPPEAPSVSLATDTGVAGDGITSEAVFNVTGLEQDATWEYSTDGGNTWTAGTGTSFTVTGEGSYNVVVRQETAKVSENSEAVSVTIDTTAPEAAAIAVDRAAGTITITFDNAVNAGEVPAASEFHVEQNGVTLEISSVAFVEGALVITVAALSSGALQVAYTGSALQDTAGNAVGTFQQIVVSDGYIEGAMVYIDANGDGVATADELLEGVTTDELGQVLLSGTAVTGDIIIKNGVNTDTGAVNSLVLKAPSGYTVVNPLTTLVQAVIDNSDASVTLAEAEAIVIAATGVVLPEGESLQSYDPQADNSADGLKNQKVVAQVAVIVEAAVEAAPESEKETVQETVVSNLSKLLVENPDGIELTEAQLTTVYTNGDGTTLVSAASTTDVLTTVVAIDDAVTLEEVITEQAKATDTVAPVGAAAIDLAAASDSGAADNITSDNTPTINVTLGAGNGEGTDIVAGDTLVLYSGSTMVASHVLTQAEVDSGSASITASAFEDGVASLTVKVMDRAGNMSAASAAEAVTVDTTAPAITSADPADANENVAVGTTVYTATTTDANSAAGITYSLKAGSDAALTIDASTGAVTLLASPDHETATSHAFTVVATDAAGNSSEKALSLNIIDLDDSAPTITSGATATAIDENSGAGQVVYTATATDDGDISDGFSYSLKAGASSDLSIDAQSGAVTLAIDPDQDTVPSYEFTVVVTDAAGNATEKAVSLTINDLDDTAPSFTSSATPAIDENTAAGEAIYTAVADDSADVSGGVTYSLAAGSDAALSIDSTTGVVTASAKLDHETQDSYSFTVVATDAAGNTAEQAVSLSVTDLNEAPTKVGSLSDLVLVTGVESSTDLSGGFNDVDDGDSLTFSLVSGELPAGMSLTSEGLLTGTTSTESTQAAYTIRATDSEGLSVDQVINIKAVSAPVVDTLTVSDTTSPASSGLAGETMTVTLTISEAFTLDTTVGAPTIGLKFGDSATEVTATYVSTSGSNLVFTATTPAGNASAVTLGSIALNGATLVGSVSGQAWEITSVGQSAEYILDNAGPEFTSLTTGSVDENAAVGTEVYTATADDVVGDITYSLKDGSDAALSISAASGVVSLLASPDFETKTSHVFTVVATDALGNMSEQEVTLSVNDINEAPTAVNDLSDVVAVTGSATSVDITSAFADVDSGDELTFSLKAGSLPDGLSLSEAGVISGAATADAAQAEFTIVATDKGGLTAEQTINVKAVSAPVVETISISDATAPTTSGVAGETISVTLTLSETFTLDTTGGSPSIGVKFGDSTTEVAASYVSTSGKNLVFSATTPAGDASSIKLSSITLNGATLVGSDSGQPLQTTAVGQSAQYVLDNTSPDITSGTSGEIHEYWPVEGVVYQAAATDASSVTYSLGTGSDSIVSIDAATGAVSLGSMPVGLSNITFNVIATDALGQQSNKDVTLAVASGQSISGPGVAQQGGVTIVEVDNGDGTYTMQLFVAEDVKSSFSAGIGSIDLVINYNATDFEEITASDVSSYFSIATPNTGTAGKIIFGGLDLTPYDVTSEDPLLSVVVTPVSEDNIQVSVTDIIFDVTDMESTVVVFGDPTIVTGDADSDAYVLAAGDAEVTTGDGNDVLVLTENTGNLFQITDFVSGADSIEFGDILRAAGYTDPGSQGDNALDYVAIEMIDNPENILALIEGGDNSLDNMFGGATVDEAGVIKLFYDADPTAGSVDLQTFDLNIGAAVAEIDDGDISGFIA